MNSHDLLQRLDDLGIVLTLVGDKICYHSEVGPPPEKLLAEMKQDREKLHSILTRREELQWPLPKGGTDNTNRQGILSRAQQSVWATNFFFEDGTYNLSGGLRLLGQLDEAAFENACKDVHRRHPSLRTVFTVEDGTPRQHILQNVLPLIMYCDLTDTLSDHAIHECLRECATIAGTKLDLEKSPPVRTRFYKLAKDDHVIFVVLHHLIADGLSVRLLMDDLARCYNARAAGETISAPVSDIDMVDFARFEQEYLLCADLASTRKYWRNIFRGMELGPLPLPLRLKVQGWGHTSNTLVVVVDANTTIGIHQIALASHTTPFLVVSAAISFMLSRFTGRDDIVIGMPVARRDLPGLEDVVGLLLDLVPIRLDVCGNPTFLELIQRTRKAVLGAISNASFPVELATIPHSKKPTKNNLFNVVITDMGLKFRNPVFSGLKVSQVEVPQVGAKFDLNFLIRNDENALHIDIEFNPRVLDKDDVFSMLSMVRAIIEQSIADRGNSALDHVQTLVIRAAQESVLPAQLCGDDKSIFDRFAAVAEAQGEAVAISHNGKVISYGAFHKLVKEVACGISQKGFGEGDIVAIMLPRSIDKIAAMLGIMGSGAACLVVDAGWPQARVNQVLRNTKVNLVISTESDSARGRITLSQLAKFGLTTEPAKPVPWSAVAYLIYTSGSTGQPKCVQVTHRNVLSLLDGTNVRFAFDASDTWLLFHECSFDFSIWEIFGCLISGGKLVIVPKWVTREPDAFVELLRRERVTVLNLTPSALRATMRSLARDPSAVETIRYLILGGEMLDSQLVDRWYSEVGVRTQLINMYGITETTVHASWKWLEAGLMTPESDIGEAIPGTSLRLLYNNGRPVDDRCVGEIYVAGLGITVGYMGQPRETALRFVPDPFDSKPGARMYRSGDLGRRNGASISYLGRRDTQVQVNGFRIELSEVEAALVGQPGVIASAAAVDQDDSGMFIVAVVVAEVDTTLCPANLLYGVQSTLPRYMVPTSVTVVRELPLTLNGKLDRSAVVAAASVNYPVSNDSKHLESQDCAGAILLDLFREVLHDNTVSNETDFFDRGGDSMRAIRLVSLAEDRGLILSVRDIYATPRLKDLAAHSVFLNAASTEHSEREKFSLLPPEFSGSFDNTVKDAYPMSALQFGMIYLKELAPEMGIYHIVLSYRVGGRMEPEAFQSASQIITDIHPILRTSFDLGHPSGPIQRVHSPVEVPMEFEDLRNLDLRGQGARIAEVVERERITDFDLTRPALFRLVVLTLSDNEYQLIFSHHHAILDGWSVNVFFEDLHTLYKQKLTGEEATVTPSTKNIFAAYIALEQEAIADPQHLEFWQARTSPESSLVAPDRGSKPVMRQLPVELPSGIITELRAVATELGVPVKALLQAAHLRVLGWMMGGTVVVTGHIVNCRPETRSSYRALGLFLNEYPMRIQLQNKTWAQLALEVHLEELALLPHRWYPRALIQQHHGRMPIFDTYFNFTDFHTTRLLVFRDNLDLRDVNEFESTHNAFGANYTVDVRTGELRLILEFDESVLARSTVILAADTHQEALAAILADPQTLCLSSPQPAVYLPRLFIAGPSSPIAEAPMQDAMPSRATMGIPKEAICPLEVSVKSVWMEVLRETNIDRDTSFFDVGGTSLQAMRVVSRLRDLYGDLSMSTFMEAPTIANLARSLSANDPLATSYHSSPISYGRQPSAGVPLEYPLTQAQEKLWQLTNQLPELPLFGMPGALRADGQLDLDVLQRTFASLLIRHAALRTRILTKESCTVQVVEPNAKLNLKKIDLRTSINPFAQCEQQIAQAVLDPIDITRAPMVQAIVFQVADDLHVIYLNIHHLICDGWSMALLMSEATQIYHDLSSGARDESWGVTPLGSGELAQAEANWENSLQAAEQRRYWVDQLAAPWPSLTGIEGNRFGPQGQTGILERLSSSSCQRRLSLADIELMSSTIRGLALTPFMVILTAFASTLEGWSGQKDIRIATMMANRVKPKREKVFGLLANTVILRLEVEANQNLVDLSLQARRVCIEAYERQELPFEEVLSSLNTRYPSEARGGKLFEVMLLLQEETPKIATEEGLQFTRYKPQKDVLRPPITPTTCDFVLAATTSGSELLLNLQYVPASTDATVAEALLDDIAVAISTTVLALREHK